MADLHDDIFDNAHFERGEYNVRRIKSFYQKLIEDIVKLISLGQIDTTKLFSFKDYPQLKPQVDKLFEGFTKNVSAEMFNQFEQSWKYGEKKQSALVNEIASKINLSKEKVKEYLNPNKEALNAFQNRKIDGLRLSDKVWKLSEQFKKEIELGLDIGIGEGKSAAKLARELKANLTDPDRLFRRVRDKHGNLVLSKNAKAYKPGQGVYRSSYKNAERLTRTENNIAYHEANFQKMQQFDFVKGIRIKLSNNPNHCPFCEAMAGEYPKDFKFWGWHPQCYSDDTEVMTNNGWKLFKDLKEDDLIFSLNPEDKTPHYVRYLKSYKYQREGKMINFHNANLDLLVTPDHKMIYLNKKNGDIMDNKIAENYSKFNGGLYRSSEYKGELVSSIYVGEHQVDFNVFSEFMGYYLADGNLYWTRKNQIKITKDILKNTETYNKIKTCLEKMPFNFSEVQGGFYFNDESFYDYLKQFGKSPEKHIPLEIKNSSIEQIVIFLDAYISCDGHIKKPKPFVGNRGGLHMSKNGERTYFTSSKKMVSDIGELLVKIGKRPSYRLSAKKGDIKQHHNGNYATNNDNYVISECSSRTATVFEKSEVSYNGFVYDIELEKFHILYVRRNGKCVWSSNCRCTVITILKTWAEMEKDNERIFAGLKPLEPADAITKLPPQFTTWVSENKQKIENAKSKPYFILNNQEKISHLL